MGSVTLESISQLLDDKFQTVTNQLTNIETTIISIQEGIGEHNLRIHSLESEVSELQQYSRRNNLIVAGIPENVNEDRIETVLKFAEAVG